MALTTRRRAREMTRGRRGEKEMNDEEEEEARRRKTWRQGDRRGEEVRWRESCRQGRSNANSRKPPGFSSYPFLSGSLRRRSTTDRENLSHDSCLAPEHLIAFALPFMLSDASIDGKKDPGRTNVPRLRPPSRTNYINPCKMSGQREGFSQSPDSNLF